MNRKIKSFSGIIVITVLTMTAFSFSNQKVNSYTLEAEVNNLRNQNGVVRFALYDSEQTFPDKNYKNYYRVLTGKINNRSAKVAFDNLPPGSYALHVLHDENMDKQIDKGFLLPKEGIGFSNYNEIGPIHKPTFKKASFLLNEDKKFEIKIIYFYR